MTKKPLPPPHAIPPDVLAQAGLISLHGATAPGQDEAILHILAAPHDLEFPIGRLVAYRNQSYPDSHPRHWAVVNFDLHSSSPRLYLFDVIAQTVETFLCAHGKGSEGPRDDGFAEVFSNMPGSNMTSLGIYRCAETFTGGHVGYALALDGLEDTNSNARSRQIVMHPASYVTPAFAQKYGRIGRSEGCPALDPAVSAGVIDRLKLGSFLLHWKTP